jgi:hypothetical protein
MAKRGRPEIKVDLTQVIKCAAVGCTDEEIADITGIGVSTFRTRKHRQEFLAALKKARSDLRMSLRRSQVVAALAGNVTAQIWLGKNLLGQKDRKEVSIEDFTDEELLEHLAKLRRERREQDDGK